ncbi:MAG: hypothetical protein Q9174_002897 [Haloplaca sp. 1 TL-2023]
MQYWSLVTSLTTATLVCLSHAFPANVITPQAGGNEDLGLGPSIEPAYSSAYSPTPGFDADVKQSISKTPLNPLGMWMNALDAVYRLSAAPMRQLWDDKIFSLPNYDVEILVNAYGETEKDIPNLQTRFVIWTIQQVMFNVWNDRWWTTVAGMPKWQGQLVGLIRIWKKEGPGPFAIVRDEEVEGLNGTDVSIVGAGRVEYKFLYGERKINSNHVFLAGLEGIGEAAENGLDSRCDHFAIPGYSLLVFELTSRKDQYGNSLLRYEHVRTALKRGIGQMVRDRKFLEMQMVVMQDGVDIGNGGWTQHG